jgi:hypothetical protein
MIDAAELARLRKYCASMDDVREGVDTDTVLALIDALEKALGAGGVLRLRAERNAARALLREALPWVGHMSDDPSIGLHARIVNELKSS